MEPVDRLAALLAGELAPDDAERLRASLAADPELARQLAGLERADAALAGLAPTAEPDGLAARLHDRLAPEVAAQVAARDELAPKRRARRPVPRWLPAAAAAAVLAVAGTGVLLTTGGGPAEDAADSLAVERAGQPSDALRTDDHAAPDVVDEDRELDADLADALLDDPAVIGLAARALDPQAGAQLAEQIRAEFGVEDAGLAAVEAAPELAPDPAPEADLGAEQDALAESFADEADEADDEAAGEEPTQTVARCLEVVLAADPAAIPAYAELARFGDEPVVVLGLVTPDAPGTAYTRTEIWVLSRADCELRRFAQAD